MKMRIGWIHRCWWRMLETKCVGDKSSHQHQISAQHNDVTNITVTVKQNFTIWEFCDVIEFSSRGKQANIMKKYGIAKDNLCCDFKPKIRIYESWNVEPRQKPRYFKPLMYVNLTLTTSDLNVYFKHVALNILALNISLDRISDMFHS